jgi:two-component system phosphate regulon sensor histidine kinase PhoR
MRSRLFTRLLTAMVVVLLLAAAMLDIAQQNILRASLRKDLAHSLIVKAQPLAQQIAPAVPAQLSALVKEDAARSAAEVRVYNRQGVLLADSQSAVSNAPLSRDVAGMLAHPRAMTQAEDGGMLAVAVPAGSYVLELRAPLHDVPGTMRAVRSSLLWATLLALLLAILVSSLMADRFARRLAQIVAFAHRLAEGDFSARIGEESAGDLAGVARALDATAARVETVFRQLQESRREMETVLDSMEEAVIAVDPNSRVHWVNRRVVSALGVSVRPGAALVQIIRDPELLAAVERALRQREASVTRAHAIAPGKVFQVSAAPMLGGSAVVVLHDVTEVARVEKTRRDFIANVSHELRTPLTSISGYAETMLEDNGTLDAQTREFLSIIARNAARMTRLTDDLLTLARIESGENKLQLRAVPASRLAREATALFSGTLLDRNLPLEYGPLCDDPVLADSDAIVQVLSNLLENAAKYGGGKILVSARRTGEMVQFSVQDFGAGIPSEHLERIFERFYRVDKGRSRDSGGTGLGLSIAKHIIRGHGGAIWAESELSRGSTFSFTLPLAADGRETSDVDRVADLTV